MRTEQLCPQDSIADRTAPSSGLTAPYIDPLVPTTMFPSPPSAKARARETPPLVVTSGSLRNVMWTSPACNRSSLAPAFRVFTTSEMFTPRHLVTPACWHWEASDASSTTSKRVVLAVVFNPPTLEPWLLSSDGKWTLGMEGSWGAEAMRGATGTSGGAKGLSAH